MSLLECISNVQEYRSDAFNIHRAHLRKQRVPAAATPLARLHVTCKAATGDDGRDPPEKEKAKTNEWTSIDDNDESRAVREQELKHTEEETKTEKNRELRGRGQKRKKIES